MKTVFVIGLLVSVLAIGVLINGCAEVASTTTTSTATSSSTSSTAASTSSTSSTTSSTTTSTTTTTLPDFAFSQRTASAFASGARYGHSSVLFDPGDGEKMWAIGGFVSSYRTNEVWSSTDGQSWVLVTPEAAFAARYFHTSVVFDNKMWVIGGYTPSGITSEVWYSTDGISWSLATLEAAFGQRASHSSVVFDGRMWLIGGEGSGIDHDDVYSSGDGITWVLEKDGAAFGERRNHASVVHDNKMWIFGGRSGGYMQNGVWNSSDGISWTRVGSFSASGVTPSSSEAARSYARAVVYTIESVPRMFITGGKNTWTGDEVYYSDMIYSTDGISWNTAPLSTTYTSRDAHTSLVFNDKIWVIGGFNGTGTYKNDVWYSPLPALP